MPPAFLQVAIPVLYVYDEGTLPEVPPGFDMGLLPVISRALKEHANTSKVTVITGAPTAAEDLPRAYTSLGLPIVKGIIEAHGGRVWLESTRGRGTTFYFTLPIAPPSP